jgi:hypothetical protein
MKEYGYLWEGSEPSWGLLWRNASRPGEEPEYSIVNMETKILLIIEDDEAAEQVVKKMLACGVEIRKAADWT